VQVVQNGATMVKSITTELKKEIMKIILNFLELEKEDD
ncbi:MAG: hypothetical protein ACI8RD_014222, partial [Bacillariaceae sp.]|jgi:hypothetical protein